MAKSPKNLADQFAVAIDNAENYFEKSLNDIIAQPLAKRQSAFYTWLENTKTKNAAHISPEAYLDYSGDIMSVTGINRKIESIKIWQDHSLTKNVLKNMAAVKPALSFNAATKKLPNEYVLRILDEASTQNGISADQNTPEGP